MTNRRNVDDTIGAFVTLAYGSTLLAFGHHGFAAANYTTAFAIIPARAWGGIFVGAALTALAAAWKSTIMAGALTCALLIGLWVAWEILVVAGVVRGLLHSGGSQIVASTPIFALGLIVMMWVSLLRYGVTRPRRRE